MLTKILPSKSNVLSHNQENELCTNEKLVIVDKNSHYSSFQLK